MSSAPHYAYYSHHKCATGWTNSILRELCFHLGLRHRTAHGPQQYGEAGGLKEWVARRNVEFLAYTNAEISEAKQLPQHRGVHVVRDPRDVIVSAYFSHLNSHPTDQWPELERHRDALQSLSKEEGLLKEIEFSRPFLMAMREWDYEQESVLEMKMEELTAEPGASFGRALQHLGLFCREAARQAGTLKKFRQYGNRGLYKAHHEFPLPLPPRFQKEKAVHPDVLDAILDAHRFERMADGRSKGEADPESHYRKGKPGDWKNHFTDRVAQSFQKTYGDIVRRLGYGEQAERNENRTNHSERREDRS
jgi:hypothetical protein